MNPKNKLYEVGKRIGLNKEEMDKIIQKDSDVKKTNSKKLLLKHHKDVYTPGTEYGTVSIHNFY